MRDWTARQVRLLVLDRDNPWPGLHHFEEAARDFFHGRDEEAMALLAQIVEAPVTVLFGKSGLGKTSLLKAGLFPRLRERGFLPVYVRLAFGSDAPPLTEQLARALREEMEERQVDAPPMGVGERLWEYLHRAELEIWSSGNRLLTPVLVLDQFEEIYTLGPGLGAAVEAFRIDLGDLAENRIPAALAERLETDEAAAAGLDLRSMRYKLIVSLREDFLAELEGDRRVIPALGRVRVRLLPMRPVQALAAVLEAAPHLLDERVARRIVRFVAAEQSDSVRQGDSLVPITGDEVDAVVEPALLSLFCRGLNEERKRRDKGRFDRELVEGAKQGIIQDYYRSCLEGLPDRVGHFVETELITEKGHRNSFAREDAVPSRLSEDELDRLIKARLIRLEERYGTQRVELTHDLLTKAVRLHRDARRAEEKLKEHEDRERKLEAEARLGRRFRALSALLAVVLGAALVMMGLVIHQSRKATLQRELADSRRLAYEAQDRVRRGDAEEGLLRAIEAMEQAQTDEAKNALQVALGAAVVRRRWEVSLHRPSAVAASPDGRRVAVATAAGTGIWDVASGRLQSSLCGHPAVALRWTPEGERLVLGRSEGSVLRWEPGRGPSDAGRLLTLIGRQEEGLRSLDLHPDGRELAVLTASGKPLLFDVSSDATAGAQAPLARSVASPAQGAWSLAFSPEGDRLAFGDDDGRLTIVDAASGRLLCRSAQPGPGLPRVRFSGPPTAPVVTSDFQFRVTSWKDDCSSAGVSLSHRDAVWDFASSAGSDYLVTVSDDGAMRLWDWTNLATAKTALHWRRNPGYVFKGIGVLGPADPAAGPNGERTRLATAAWKDNNPDEGRLTLWDVAAPKERAELLRMRSPGEALPPAAELLGRARQLQTRPLVLDDQTLACPGGSGS